MKNKRIIYALTAFLMLAANSAGVVQVFAEEVGGTTNDEAGAIVQGVDSEDGEGALEVGEATGGETGGAVANEEAVVPAVVADGTEGGADEEGIVTPSAIVADNELADGVTTDLAVAGTTPLARAAGEKAVTYDYGMLLSDETLNLGLNLSAQNTNRCSVTEGGEGLSCDATVDGGAVTATAAGAYTVKFERYHFFYMFSYWETVATVTVGVFDLKTSAQEETVLAQGEDFEYTIDAEKTFGDVHTTVKLDGNIIAEADGTDSIKIDTSKSGEYTVEIVNTSAEAAELSLSDKYSFWVYEVVADPADAMYNDAARESVRGFVAEQIAEILNSGSSATDKVVMDYSVESLKTMISKDSQTFTSRLVMYELTEEYWEYAEAYDAVMGEIRDTEEIATFYEGYIEIYLGDTYVGVVYELDNPITMALAIPSGLATAPEGYVRTFSVVRGHFGIDMSETAERLATSQDGEIAMFENAKYSSFAIVYEDTPSFVEVTSTIETPETGMIKSEGGSSAQSADLVGLVALTSGLVLALGAVKLAKRK